MPGVERIDWPLFGDDAQGMLAAIEVSGLPFAPQRIYYLWDVPPGVTRGGHAHILEDEVFVCIRGNVTLQYSQGSEALETVRLDSPGEGYYVGRQVWHEFTDWSPDALLLCLSSVPYSPGSENYIQDYEQFLTLSQDPSSLLS